LPCSQELQALKYKELPLIKATDSHNHVRVGIIRSESSEKDPSQAPQGFGLHCWFVQTYQP
jgi:hypothetical protein